MSRDRDNLLRGQGKFKQGIAGLAARWRAYAWTVVGSGGLGAFLLASHDPAPGQFACAYRLVHRSLYGGTARSYHDRCRDGDRARGDRAGFYDGIIVRHAGRELVMVGPPVNFVVGEEAQLSLF